MGVREQVEELGQRFIRDYLPDQHREFYAELPYLIVGSTDVSGRPWASIVVGERGFIQTPDARTMRIETRRIPGDPLGANLVDSAPLGILGIEFQTRRRNRVTARVTDFSDESLSLRVEQAFGNCPQYIQAREPVIAESLDALGQERPSISFDRLGERARQIIESADNFFIATQYVDDPRDPTQGSDVSHRGGKPGFVRIEDDRTLVFPDFSGNNHFNTIGNILLNPVAGLLFIDFENGDALYLTCRAEVVWDSDEKRAFTGAERLVRFTIDEGQLLEGSIPIRWKFVDYSPVLERTGSWLEVDAAIGMYKNGSHPRPYRVVRVAQESNVITSFYLAPDDDQPLGCHKAGQFLPVEFDLGNEIVRRTYTISNAPNGEYYRLSIKRQPAPDEHTQPGLVSNYFHNNISIGSRIFAHSPRGQFTLTENPVRPVVFLSGGVGITPMISMLEELRDQSRGCGCERPVWFIHGAISSREHAFRDYVLQLANEWQCLKKHFAYTAPDPDDRLGRDYDSEGYITIDLLKSLLPLNDYEFYCCGPPAFMRNIYSGLKDLNVADERIHYEFFGPGTILLDSRPPPDTLIRQDAKPVVVRFARSDVEARWDANSGTLLDLAEAQGLSPLYSCRSGICATCTVKVIEGEVDYVNTPIDEPKRGTALICSAYPASRGGELVLDL